MEGKGEDRLLKAFIALANPVRLELLRHLRTPRTLSEISVQAGEGDRPLSRQAVREHVDRLLDAGLVDVRETERNRGPTVEYVLNPPALYALMEEFRALAKLRSAAQLERETMPGQPPAGVEPPRPCLVLVKGVDEGRVYDLATGARDEWLVGRRRGIAISLDFDPFVSTENTRISWDGGQHLVEDLPSSRNGTSVNFRLLAPGERAALRTGDVLGVGRSLLLYRGA